MHRESPTQPTCKVLLRTKPSSAVVPSLSCSARAMSKNRRSTSLKDDEKACAYARQSKEPSVYGNKRALCL